MNMKLTGKMLKLYVVELSILLIVLYGVMVAISKDYIWMAAGLAIYVFAFLIGEVVDYYFLDYS
jgi:predicted lysophospholipase L1 biosynthesis ABC-type transport system permease subunit